MVNMLIAVVSCDVINFKINLLCFFITFIKHVIFPVFTEIPGFLKKTFKIFIVEIRVKMMQKLGVRGRDGRKLQMW